MDSQIEGLSSSVSGVQNELDNHGVLSHILDLQTMKEILDRLIVGQDRLSAANERLSGTQDRSALAQARVADESAALCDGAMGQENAFKWEKVRCWGVWFDGMITRRSRPFHRRQEPALGVPRAED